MNCWHHGSGRRPGKDRPARRRAATAQAGTVEQDGDNVLSITLLQVIDQCLQGRMLRRRSKLGEV